jgi:hypothetical protein
VTIAIRPSDERETGQDKSYFSEKRKRRFAAKSARARHQPERTTKIKFLAHSISECFRATRKLYAGKIDQPDLPVGPPR